ncbi:MAG TPA: hypothetical protein VKR58_04710 [Aquella sp.]|nr:hypothetical protein [Aquella sp.]
MNIKISKQFLKLVVVLAVVSGISLADNTVMKYIPPVIHDPSVKPQRSFCPPTSFVKDIMEHFLPKTEENWSFKEINVEYDNVKWIAGRFRLPIDTKDHLKFFAAILNPDGSSNSGSRVGAAHCEYRDERRGEAGNIYFITASVERNATPVYVTMNGNMGTNWIAVYNASYLICGPDYSAANNPEQCAFDFVQIIPIDAREVIVTPKINKVN